MRSSISVLPAIVGFLSLALSPSTLVGAEAVAAGMSEVHEARALGLGHGHEHGSRLARRAPAHLKRSDKKTTKKHTATKKTTKKDAKKTKTTKKTSSHVTKRATSCAASYKPSASVTTVTGTGTLPKPTTFVKRSGTSLILNGKAYKIVGPNMCVPRPGKATSRDYCSWSNERTVTGSAIKMTRARPPAQSIPLTSASVRPWPSPLLWVQIQSVLPLALLCKRL